MRYNLPNRPNTAVPVNARHANHDYPAVSALSLCGVGSKRKRNLSVVCLFSKKNVSFILLHTGTGIHTGNLSGPIRGRGTLGRARVPSPLVGSRGIAVAMRLRGPPEKASLCGLLSAQSCGVSIGGYSPVMGGWGRPRKAIHGSSPRALLRYVARGLGLSLTMAYCG
jgi:hypothetical protein